MLLITFGSTLIGYKPLIFVSISILSVSLISLLRMFFLQPTVMFLATSTESTNMLARVLVNLELAFTASYLDQQYNVSDDELKPEIDWAFYRRDDIDDKWSSYVRTMMSFAPIIAIDLRTKSVHLEQEIEWLIDFGHQLDVVVAEKRSRFISEQSIYIIHEDGLGNFSNDEIQSIYTSLSIGRKSTTLVSLTEFIHKMNDEYGLQFFYNDKEYCSLADEIKSIEQKTG